MLLASCREPLPPAVPVRHVTPPPVVAEFRVKEALLAGGSVSVHVEMPLTASGPRPTVIALIGDPHRYLGAGFVAVRYSINWTRINGPPPSPPPADQAVGKWVLASPSADVLGERYLREIAATATDYVPIVIDWLATLTDVDAKRIGMAGISTNGFVTLQAVAADRRIRAAVAISACGDYHDFLQHSSMGMGDTPLALAPAYDEWLQRQEIVNHPRDLVHAAVLMVNKVGDELIPISCADATARALERAYRRAGASDRFRYVRLPVAGHGMGADENSETFAWLQQWLQGQ
jgi:dienelactone hydrolase